MVESSGSSKIHGREEKKVTHGKEEGLSRFYGETRIVLLPRDPFWAYAYWELTKETLNEISGRIGIEVFEKSRPVLRVYDVTNIQFDGTNAHKYFDIAINYDADNWYINMPEANRNWCVELGLVLPDGRFIMLVRSNMVMMPRYGVSPLTDEQWGVLQKEFERLLKLSGVEQIGKSSFDVAKLMRERWEEIVSISSMRPASPLGISSFRKAPEEKPAKKVLKKDFWLKAETELIVFGTTEADASLFVDNKEVKLNGDGSFSLRLNLTDGKREIPVRAVSKDNSMKKSITFIVSRKTK